MKLFKPLYERALVWAAHKRAPAILFVLSLCEAVFFPVAPEIMLAPMCLARRDHAFRYAAISLGGSLVGMCIGYSLGYFAIDWLLPWIEHFGYAAHFHEIEKQARDDGFWLLLIAGFVPIPFKIFTLASGAVHMPLLPFFAGATLGRGKRVFLVAGAIKLGGEKGEAMLHRWIEPVGWLGLLLLAALVGWLYWRGIHG
ncbi:MAG: DedA family protein [Proteobacteria bacterium]|nr:DedA family protein [Pseudomonadota bacterium]